MSFVIEAHIFDGDVALSKRVDDLFGLANGDARIVRAMNNEEWSAYLVYGVNR